VRNDLQCSQVKTAQAEITFILRQKAATISGHGPEENTTIWRRHDHSLTTKTKTVLLVRNLLQVPPRKSWRTSQPSQKQQNRRTDDNQIMKDERRKCACGENSDWGRGQNAVEDSRSVSQWMHGKRAELNFLINAWRP